MRAVIEVHRMHAVDAQKKHMFDLPRTRFSAIAVPGCIVPITSIAIAAAPRNIPFVFIGHLASYYFLAEA